jgi:hypothetical protein
MSSLSPMLSPSSTADWWKIIRHDPLMSFLAPFLATLAASISLSFIQFAPLGSLITIALTFTIFSLTERLPLPGVVRYLIISLLEILLWYITLTPHEPAHHAFTIAHYLTPSPLSLNPFYPIISYSSLWIEFTAAALSFLFILHAAFPFVFGEKKYFALTALYAFSMLAIYAGIYYQNFSSYFVGHLSVLLFSLFSVPLTPPLVFIYNSLLIYTSHYIQSQSILLVGPIESLSNIVLGPLGILFFTLYTLGDSGPEKDSNALMAFIINLTMVFISAKLSRSLMFIIGLIGVASYLIWIGFMRFKGQGGFIMILLIGAASILVAVFYQQ